MIELIGYFCLAIFISFLCSLLEAVLLSLTPSFVSSLKDKKPKAGKRLEKLKLSIDRPLAAILSLNTIAHTVGAAGVGAQAQVVFENLPLSVISGVLTLGILVISEIIPKTIGALYWRSLAIPCSHILQIVIFSMWPLVILSSGISRLISGDKKEPQVSWEEIEAMAALGHEEGVIDKQDSVLLHSVMNFKNVKIDDILTPRPVIKLFRSGTTIKELMQEGEPPTYSRFPILQDSDRVIGFVLRDDILAAAARSEWQITVDDLIKPITILPEQIPAKKAFGLFLRDNEHIAAVVDEFGSFAGVVTLEDVLETLIGHEIMDEGDEVEDLRAYARKFHKKASE